MIDLEQIKGFNDENTNNDLARKLKGNTEEKPICRCLLETVKCLLLMSFLGQKSIQTYCDMTQQSSGQIRLLSLRLVQTYEHVHEELRHTIYLLFIYFTVKAIILNVKTGLLFDQIGHPLNATSLIEEMLN